MGKLGMFGRDVRPVAMISFLPTYVLPESVSTFHIFPDFEIFFAESLNTILSFTVVPENFFCIENASKYVFTCLAG